MLDFQYISLAVSLNHYFDLSISTNTWYLTFNTKLVYWRVATAWYPVLECNPSFPLRNLSSWVHFSILTDVKILELKAAACYWKPIQMYCFCVWASESSTSTSVYVRVWILPRQYTQNSSLRFSVIESRDWVVTAQ